MRARECLEVFGQTATEPQPAERAFHNPALLEHHKALCAVRALHDLKLGPSRPTHRSGRLPALVSAIRDHPLQKGKEPPHLFQNTETAIPILHVARQNGAAEHQAERVNDGMALAPFDLLGRIIAHRVDRAPPLSAPFTLWLSTMAVVGLASLPASSRACSYRAWWSRPSVPSHCQRTK